ncbi:putative quinol monooxygenase [Pseudoalteromonas byunsanensis]|uniref:Antibiotic biosynthesis monooxygenase n=1 Tax=Pseudoalteromonas byunsanensis TaxID=327939 RepID=A0A1S1N4Q2_9GAMM|nr:antibiotic biosynthesis monooxygenase [Pseudoalteromonas byunsanensis]OHU94976.1 antibiotic biosynthesis monooxygenase [Pseudoalteromonas byunsanensis]
MNKIILRGYILVPQPELCQVKQALDEHIELTRSESGCIVFEVTQHSDDPLRFDVYEEFVDAEAFKQHQNRVIASDWGAKTQNVARHYHIEGL